MTEGVGTLSHLLPSILQIVEKYEMLKDSISSLSSYSDREEHSETLQEDTVTHYNLYSPVQGLMSRTR